MKVYQIRAADGADWVEHYRPTRKTADDLRRELKRDGYEDITVEPFEVTPTRVGVARALQNVIDKHCLNEH